MSFSSGSVILFLVVVVVLIFSVIWLIKRRRDEQKVTHKLQQLDKMREAFLANTSHELKTPINGIIGISNSLIDGATGLLLPEQQAQLKNVSYKHLRAHETVLDILYLPSLEKKK